MATLEPLVVLSDRNLRLALLDELMVRGGLPRFDRETYRRMRLRLWDEEGYDLDEDPDYVAFVKRCVRRWTEEGDDPAEDSGAAQDTDADYDYYDEALADALSEIPVTMEQSAGVRDLHWRVGDPVISTIWPLWDGESDDFNIRSLDGIAAALPNLESLVVAGLSSVTDLSPLARCTRLRELGLSGEGAVTDIGPLAELGSLRRLDLEYQDVRDLRPLIGLPIEGLRLDGRPDMDLAPLEHVTSLRTLSIQRKTYAFGSEPPALTLFDNARVVEVLRERGVSVQVR